jgi:hypothetical protein
MTPTPQKEKELKWFHAFQKGCLECPRSKPQQPEPPAPDIFFLESDLGIEITEYLLGQGKSGSQPRQLESVHQKIAHAAQVEYEIANKRCLQVSIIWATHECPKGRKVNEIAQAIARLVAAQHFQNERMCRVNWEQFDSPLLQKYVDNVGVILIGEQGQSCWSSTAGSFLPEASPRIQVALDEKELKVSEYRKICQHLWLLIVASGEFLCSQFFPDRNLPTTRFYSSYERVFLLEEPCNKVYEIKVEQRRR